MRLFVICSPRWPAALLVVALGIAAAALAFPADSAAHDLWINRKRLVDPVSRQWCCNEHDCERVGADGVKENGTGYTVFETGEAIPHSRIIWKSEDGHWWRCRNLSDNSTRCLIGPPPSL